MSKYRTYTDLAKQTTEYARRMARLSNRIFGEVPRPMHSKSMKVVKLFSEEPWDKKDYITKYYPRYYEIEELMQKLRYYGLFRDEHADFRDEMNRMRALRGKVDKYKERLAAERAARAAAQQT